MTLEEMAAECIAASSAGVNVNFLVPKGRNFLARHLGPNVELSGHQRPARKVKNGTD